LIDVSKYSIKAQGLKDDFVARKAEKNA
jgi:hypothetical protein